MEKLAVDIFLRLQREIRVSNFRFLISGSFLISYFLFLISYFSLRAQQVPQFSNYLFNNYGINPAYVSKGSCLEIRVGRRNQWVGFPNGPLTTFISVNKTFGRKPFRNGWHGLGMYLEQDKQDILKSDGIYPSYSYHLKVSEKYYASMGVFTGFKMMSMSGDNLDPSDPAFAMATTVFVIPDIAVGTRLYSKENFFDLAVRQVYKSKVKFGAKKIGTPSKLTPHINFIAGKRIDSKAYYYSYIPSVNLRFTFLSPPSLDVSFMLFVKNQIGFGLSYRYNDAIIAMAQYRYKNLLTLALSYDYVLSRMRVGTSSSREVMFGFSSCPPGQDLYKKGGCPAYDH